MSKNIALNRLYSAVEIEAQNIETVEFDNWLKAFDEELKALHEKYGLKLIHQNMRFIPMQKMSLTWCEQCGNLMINRDINPMRFNKEQNYIDLDTDYNDVIWDGGTFEGKELCMECLPTTHRWGCFS